MPVALKLRAAPGGLARLADALEFHLLLQLLPLHAGVERLGAGAQALRGASPGEVGPAVGAGGAAEQGQQDGCPAQQAGAANAAVAHGAVGWRLLRVGG